MYFVKFIGAGLDSKNRDPRTQILAEFYCCLCEKYSHVDVTGFSKSFNCNEERRCPKCGKVSAEDHKMNLKAQIEKLTMDRKRIDIELDRIERELNGMVEKEVNLDD